MTRRVLSANAHEHGNDRDHNDYGEADRDQIATYPPGHSGPTQAARRPCAALTGTRIRRLPIAKTIRIT